MPDSAERFACGGNPRHHALRALIVEPNADCRDKLAGLLEQLGVETAASASVEEALASAKARAPDLAIINAPILSLESERLCSRLRNAANRPYLFLLAIVESDAEAPVALATGADDFLICSCSKENPQAPSTGRLLSVLRQAIVRGWIDTIQRASELVSGARSFDGLFRDVARRLRSMLPVDHFVVTRDKGDEIRFEVVDMTGNGESAPSFFLDLPRTQVCPRRLPPRESGYFVCDEVRDRDPRLADGMCSCICLPLLQEGSSIGTLSLASHVPRAFEEVILPYLGSLAVQVAHAVANIERYEAARSQAEHLRTIVREVHHRIKNNLQGIMGLLACEAEREPALAASLQHARSQLHAVAEVHNLLSHDTRERVALIDLIGGVCRAVTALSPHRIEIALEEGARELELSATEAVPLALILNELIQNAVSHGYPAGARGTIRVGAARDGAGMRIHVANDGVPPPSANAPAPGRGIGLELVRALLPRKGRFSMRRDGNWTVAEIVLP